MSSSYLNPVELELFDARWSGPGGDILVEVKRTSNARDLRDALLALAYALEKEAGRARGLCVLTKTRFSEPRLQEELARFRSVVRPGLGDLIFLVAIEEGGRLIGNLPLATPDLERFIMDTAQADSGARRVSRQTVKAYLVECWLGGLGPQTASRLGSETGASYPTVAAALEDLRALGVLSEDRWPGAMLREPSWEAWRRLAEMQSTDRKIIRFIDPSGQARPPSHLAGRLESVQHKGAGRVEIGGVLGAQLYYPELDISAAPRLDLCVYDGDIRFIRKLDAALVETDDPGAKAAVVLHLIRKLKSAPRDYRRDLRAASPLDCLADLLELGYQAEARDFALALARLTYH